MPNYDFDVVTGPSAPPGMPQAALEWRLRASPSGLEALRDAHAGASPRRLAPAPRDKGDIGKL